jgi:hypothetical protein
MRTTDRRTVEITCDRCNRVAEVAEVTVRGTDDESYKSLDATEVPAGWWHIQNWDDSWLVCSEECATELAKSLL